MYRITIIYHKQPDYSYLPRNEEWTFDLVIRYIVKATRGNVKGLVVRRVSYEEKETCTT